MMFFKRLYFCLFIFFFTSCFFVDAQVNSSANIPYQGIARNSSGQIIANQSIAVKLGIFSDTTTIWEEVHNVSTDQNGLYKINIGSGISTGIGIVSSYSSIPWDSTNLFVRINIDFFGGSSFNFLGENQFFSVPYSLYSIKSGSFQNLSLIDLLDVDTVGNSPTFLLKWNGIDWKPTDDIYSDTVNYASNIIPFNWSLAGNQITSTNQFIGNQNNADLRFSTFNIESARLSSSGLFGVGTAFPNAKIHAVGVNGFLSIGSFGNGSFVDSTLGTKLLWYPRKAALIIGQTSNGFVGDSQIGDYSFSSGLNCIASGTYSVALGINSQALAENFISIGKDCVGEILPSAPISNGGTVAMGDSVVITYTRSIGMGHGIYSSAGACAFGYRNQCSGNPSSAVFGSYNNTNGASSIVFGYNATSNGKTTSFLFGDGAIGSVTVANTMNNQFMARASGGVVFYSDNLLNNGIQVFPGSGSWSMVSDRSKKENFQKVDGEILLKKIQLLKVKKWSYKSQSKKIEHLGPFAQDFYSIFNFGESTLNISSVDINGITISGIKELTKKTSTLLLKFESTSDIQIDLSELNASYDDIDSRLKNIELNLLKEIQTNDKK